MKEFLDFLKLPTYILGALAIASGILLFAPDSVIRLLYMTEFKANYGFTLGIVFITSVSILAVLLIKLVYGGISEKHNLKKLKEAQTKFLMKVDSEKVYLINTFIQQPTHTMMLPMHDGLVIELQRYNVISPAGQTHMVSMLNPQITFFLQPWVLKRINENEELQTKFYGQIVRTPIC